MPMSRVSPVLVLVLTTIIESVRVPQRSLPASDPMSRVLTRGTSAHGSSAAVSASATSRCSPGLSPTNTASMTDDWTSR